MNRNKFLVLLAAVLLSFQTQAALVSGPDIIGAVSVQEDSPTNNHQQAFNENQSVFLTSAINVDGGTIAAGQTVDSHLIFLNSKGNTRVDDRQTWGFDGIILGVMSNKSGSLMGATNGLFAAFNDYFTTGSSLPFNAAGLESNNIASGDGYIINGLLLDLRMVVTEPGDWIRVITASAVPVPAALFLFGPALLGFIGLRRKAKLSA
ncbi:hypothetical protein A9Q79_03015 [Methylophaga sp. 42_25_T18]|mgnify:CR=1 FL=1|nr:hypothetical protein A9Q79_03015 [Methylophaga sp. 42_25_T18]OUR87687.1 hypothetical protein A9Q92_04045 [Methylophaga sp. 42_8_T64]